MTKVIHITIPARTSALTHYMDTLLKQHPYLKHDNYPNL